MEALVLRGEVVAVLTVVAGENDLVARHCFLGTGDWGLGTGRLEVSECRVAQSLVPSPYFRIFVTTPAPTVRPPSLIANRNCSSIAIGVISSIVICTLSPGMTISIPSGSSTEPVTSVVRK